MYIRTITGYNNLLTKIAAASASRSKNGILIRTTFEREKVEFSLIFSYYSPGYNYTKTQNTIFLDLARRDLVISRVLDLERLGNPTNIEQIRKLLHEKINDMVGEFCYNTDWKYDIPNAFFRKSATFYEY